MCILASKVRGIPSIHFTDNDITAHVDGLEYEELYNRLEAQATYNIVPSAFDTKELTKWGADSEQIITYDGYKEDIYIANFEPDSSFTDKLPFEEYIVVRPEALDAAYVDSEFSLVPQLLQHLVEYDKQVVYLPRGRGDKHYAHDYEPSQVFVPEKALDGLQLVWHADCTMTGSGTMAREAACMNKPAVSFFPNTPLSVDQKMIEENRVFHSREVGEIMDYVTNLSEQDMKPDNNKSKEIQKELCSITQELIAHCASEA
ncbi:hypothetical protein ZOD2009_21017 [Haladaptatus paucihalophilus DX253]|nr:hypothetical protein ZOD2009_21017 [Haladaptatus paucihalophilus DX253]